LVIRGREDAMQHLPTRSGAGERSYFIVERTWQQQGNVVASQPLGREQVLVGAAKPPAVRRPAKVRGPVRGTKQPVVQRGARERGSGGSFQQKEQCIRKPAKSPAFFFARDLSRVARARQLYDARDHRWIS
jgi:hypothetical protein